MFRRPLCATLLLLGMLLAASCGIGVSSLTQSQIQELIQQQNIQPVAVEDVGGQSTAILYKNNRWVGCYIAWVGRDISFARIDTNVVSTAQDIKNEPISVITDDAFDHEIACLLFNDQNIMKRVRYIELTFPDGVKTIEQVQNQDSAIISRRADNYYDSIDIVIYDKDRREILHVLAWGGTEVRLK